MTLGLLVYKEGRFITPVLSGSSETVHIAYLAQARDKSPQHMGKPAGGPATAGPGRSPRATLCRELGEPLSWNSALDSPVT